MSKFRRVSFVLPNVTRSAIPLAPAYLDVPTPPTPPTAIGPVPRTQGILSLSTKAVGAGSGIDKFRTSGAMKALFPRGHGVQAIMINTSGGLTGGDQLDIEASAGTGSQLTLTTQAAERAYRSKEGHARMDSHLSVAAGASLHWLPQELILFEGARLDRSLTVDLAEDAKFLMVEPMIFGRTAMGEVLNDVDFKDKIRVTRDGVPLYFDGMHLTGDVAAQLTGRAVAARAGAMVSLLYVAPDAESHLAPLRALLPQTGGASLLAPDVLALRMVASDSHTLRSPLLPILDRLSGDGLPTSWRL